MSYLFNLPVELYLTLKDLPSYFHKKIELDAYTIKNYNFIQIAKDLSRQISKLLENENDFKEIDLQKIKDCFYLLLVLSEQYKKILDLIETPQTLTELCSRVIAYHKIHVRKSLDVDLKSLDNLSKSEVELAKVVKNYSEVTGDPINWIDVLVKLINKDARFIHKNLILYCILLRFMSLALVSYPDASEKIMSKIITLSENLGAEYLLAISYHFMGMIKTMQSLLTKSLDYYEKSLNYSRNLGISLPNSTKNNIGVIYISLGKLDEAEKIFRELLDINDMVPYRINLAGILKQKDKLDEALAIIEPLIDPNIPIISGHIEAHEIYIKMGELDKANELETMAENICERNDIFINQIRLHEMQANRNHYLGNLSIAKEKYEYVLDEYKKRNNLREIFKTYLKIINVQIDLYALKPDDTTIKNKLYSLINTTIQLSDEQGMAQASIEGLILRGDILKRDELLEDARMDYFNAKKLADEYNYENLSIAANGKLEEVMSILDGEKAIKEDEKSFFSKLKDAASNLLRINTKSTYQEVDYTIHGILIIAPGGVSIYDYYISNRLGSEPALISGLISAVSSFISEIASGKGFLKSISHEDMSVVMEPADEFIIVCIASEETFSIRDKTRKFSEKTSDYLVNYKTEIERGEIPDKLDNTLNHITEKIFVN